MRAKWFVSMVLIVLAAGLFAQETPDTETMQKALKKELNIGSVVKTGFRDDTNQKFERIKVTTKQKKNSPFMGALRFTVEFTGKTGESRWGQISKAQAKHPPEYQGQDEWTFEFPHGDLDSPKITAYALEYGWNTNKVFTPVVQKFYNVENADEITARNKDPKKKLKILAKTTAVRSYDGE